MWKQVLLIVVLAASFALEVYSQTIQNGDWVGKIIHKNGLYMNVTYEVRNSEDGLQILMDVAQYGSFRFKDIRVTEDSLSFVWTPSFDLPCMLALLPDGVYHGACPDPWGGFGGAIMAPPGSDREKLLLDETTFKRIAGIDHLVETEQWLLGESYPKGSAAELDGLIVNYVDVGDGSVTVVLIAGLGDNLTSWESLQQRLAPHFRVIAYDRPGLGMSQESVMRRTPGQMANELHSLLEKAAVPPPYVLIAHAEGSLTARWFVDLYRDKVQGLMLIHPHHEKQAEIWENLDADSWDTYWNQVKGFQSMLPGAAGQEFEVYAGIIDGEEDPDLSKVPLVPTVVLSAGRASEAPKWVGDSEKGLHAWSEFHASWVKKMPQGAHMIVESGSYIHQEQTEKVAEYIHNMLDSE